MKMVLCNAFLGTLACSCVFAANCLPYEPQPVTLSGVFSSHEGLRGWWGLKLNQPICTIKGQPDTADIPYSGVEELQFVFLNGDADKYRPFINGKVTVAGKLMGRFSGYHMTPVLIIVDEMKSSEVSAVSPQNTQSATLPLRDLASYSASVTVLPHPISRVITQAWEKDPSSVFADSDRYIDHMFNGALDVMWVKCRDGYSAEYASSNTKSPVFQMDERNPKIPFWGVAVSSAERTNITFRCFKQ